MHITDNVEFSSGRKGGYAIDFNSYSDNVFNIARDRICNDSGYTLWTGGKTLRVNEGCKELLPIEAIVTVYLYGNWEDNAITKMSIAISEGDGKVLSEDLVVKELHYAQIEYMELLFRAHATDGISALIPMDEGDEKSLHCADIPPEFAIIGDCQKNHQVLALIVDKRKLKRNAEYSFKLFSGGRPDMDAIAQVNSECKTLIGVEEQ